MRINSLDIEDLEEIHAETTEHYYIRMLKENPTSEVWRTLLADYYSDKIRKKLLVAFIGEK